MGRWYLFAVIAAGLLITVAVLHNPAGACQEKYRDDGQIYSGNHRIEFQKAVSASDKEKGLGGRLCLAPSQGMLFVFDKPDYYAFWMKDMRFSLDIVWIGSNKKVVQVDETVSPNSYPKSIQPAKPALYVLEVGAGQAAKVDIVSGRQLKF